MSHEITKTPTLLCYITKFSLLQAAKAPLKQPFRISYNQTMITVDFCAYKPSCCRECGMAFCKTAHSFLLWRDCCGRVGWAIWVPRTCDGLSSLWTLFGHSALPHLWCLLRFFFGISVRLVRRGGTPVSSSICCLWDLAKVWGRRSWFCIRFGLAFFRRSAAVMFRRDWNIFRVGWLQIFEDCWIWRVSRWVL